MEERSVCLSSSPCLSNKIKILKLKKNKAHEHAGSVLKGPDRVSNNGEIMGVFH